MLTPFIVRWPGHVPANATNETTVLTAADLLPTLCAAAGAILPEDYRGDGENLIDSFQGKAIARTKPIFWKVPAGAPNPRSEKWAAFAMREGDWKLYTDAEGKRAELYNVVKDLAETKELGGQHPDLIARMTQALTAWKEALPKSPNPECITRAASAPAESIREISPRLKRKSAKD